MFNLVVISRDIRLDSRLASCGLIHEFLDAFPIRWRFVRVNVSGTRRSHGVTSNADPPEGNTINMIVDLGTLSLF
jgi:hypothetical protein